MGVQGKTIGTQKFVCYKAVSAIEEVSVKPLYLYLAILYHNF